LKIRQLSLFVQNQPGQLVAPLRVLAEAGIDVLTLSLADTEKYGILRLVVDQWERAQQLFTERGFVVNVVELVALEVEDRPGGLAELLELLDQAGANIEYMYAFTYGRAGRAVMLFRFEDPEAAMAALSERGVSVLDSVDLGRRADPR
jgi:hypothetical protein